MEFTSDMFPRGMTKQLVEDRTKLVERFVECYYISEDELEALYSKYYTEDEHKRTTGAYLWWDNKGNRIVSKTPVEGCSRYGRYMHQFGEIRNLIWRMITRYNLQDERTYQQCKDELKAAILYWHIFNNADDEYLDWEKAKKDLKIRCLSHDKWNLDPITDKDYENAELYIMQHKHDNKLED